ncbi:MAG: ATP-binding protein [Candidatus Eremiobacteraeota bacterium]|nr:ATP-binding protein [Candidatus Eremiobacteraeota bacterium]MBC5801731.1 ATP-binding protein [Candidatus Eremiobacteraeota bacterium]MBC5821521.1 ATP-binding protein [Candidatus Eremiobacteraeota bacterium]
MNAAAAMAEHLGTVELRIPSKPEWVAVARLAVAAIANRLPFSVEEIEDLKLAIAESCTICIQHGAGGETIDMTCETLTSHLRIVIRDHRYRLRATGSEAARAGAAPAVEGLGIFLIQALMDELEYSIDPQMGTELVMVKRVGT